MVLNLWFGLPVIATDGATHKFIIHIIKDNIIRGVALVKK